MRSRRKQKNGLGSKALARTEELIGIEAMSDAKMANKDPNTSPTLHWRLRHGVVLMLVFLLVVGGIAK